MPYKDPEKRREYHKKYLVDYMKRYRKTHKPTEEFKQKRRAYMRKHRASNIDKTRADWRKWNRKKIEAKKLLTAKCGFVGCGKNISKSSVYCRPHAIKNMPYMTTRNYALIQHDLKKFVGLKVSETSREIVSVYNLLIIASREMEALC